MPITWGTTSKLRFSFSGWSLADSTFLFFSSNTAKHFLAPNKVSLHVSEIVSGIISGTISEIISKNISEIISKLIAETIAELISEILPTSVVFLS